jgi:rhamnulokinase
MSIPVVAIDFGASSTRVCRVDLGAGSPRVDVVHRTAHAPRRDADGALRWDWDRLLAELDVGLERALAAGPVASIGIDAWGVDYGLLDARRELVEPPVSYRDTRTSSYREVVERIGTRRLYELTGVQLLAFNTIFQLAAHNPTQLARAAHVVMLPELVVAHLTGEIVAETTSAGTTGLLDLATGNWSRELCDAIALPRALLPEILPAGTRVGCWRGVPVHLIGGHDTASAVLGGARPGEAFVSAGTWLLVGREQPSPDTSVAAQEAGFTNEQGAMGGIRFLRNVAGWWLVEECRRAWADDDLGRLLADAAAAPYRDALIDATDERFLAPPDMERELRAAADLGPAASRATVVRTAVESMAATTAAVVESLPVDDEKRRLHGIRIFGGGLRSPLYLDALRRRADVPVSVGPVEATAVGNALAQGIALGVFEDVRAARATLGHPQEVA